VSDVQWSPYRPNLLCVALAGQSTLQFYNTSPLIVNSDSSISTLRSPLFDIKLPGEIKLKRMCWSRRSKREDIDHGGISSLVVSTSQGFLDVHVQESEAVQLSASGDVLLTAGSWVTELHGCCGESGLRSPDRYSLNASDCLLVLGDIVTAPATSVADMELALRLSRVWGWIDRCEYADLDLALGVSDLLHGASDSPSKPVPFAPALNMYISGVRETAKRLCGWAVLAPTNREQGLEDLVEDLEASGAFDRAAALALWHGNVKVCLRF
jgi:hypothetical protein